MYTCRFLKVKRKPMLSLEWILHVDILKEQSNADITP